MNTIKLYNDEAMKKSLVGTTRTIKIYNGKAEENLTSIDGKADYEETVEIKSEFWKNSANRSMLLKERKQLEEKARTFYNAATGYDAKTIQALAGIYTLDLSRQADDYTDYTALLFQERADENAPEIVNLRDYMPYTGKEMTIKGAGDTVPLMEHALPKHYPVNMEIRGFGDITTLRQLVFNPFHKTEMILESAARILADEKNKEGLGGIVSASYDAEHTQEADPTGAHDDMRINTIRKAIKKALTLRNIPTSKQNGGLRYKVYLLLNPIDVLHVEPIVNGALRDKTGVPQITTALKIDGIVPYGGGLNDGAKWNAETLSYPGIEQGTAYVFVKIDVFGGYRIVKRGETMEVGQGDVLGLSSERRAWHRIRGIFNEWVLPVTDASKHYGAAIKVTLP